MSFVSRTRHWLIVVMLVLISGAIAAGGTHTIKKGDTLYSLAKRYKTSVSKIMAANKLSNSDVKKLKIGRRLIIPSASGSSTTVRASSSSSTKSRIGAGKRVIIDAGHGGKDWGAYKGGIKESYLNLRVANKLKGILQSRGYSVTMTRSSDHFVSLSRRASIAKQ